jgi:acetoacetate decarboxylase
MGLVKSLEELATAPSVTFDAYDAETLFALWETPRETVKRLLPPPLQPAKRPLALAVVSAHPQTSVGPVYREAALALRAEADGQEGFYFLAMPVTDSMALVYSRDSLGYPRKVADISFCREGRRVGCWVQRQGVRYFAVQAQLTGSMDTLGAAVALDEVFDSAAGSMVMIAYSFKYFPAPNLDGFDYPPQLVREEVEYRPMAIDRGKATVALRPSEYDPWSEVEVVRPLGAVYLKGANSMRKGQIISEVGPRSFASYAQLRVDLR